MIKLETTAAVSIEEVISSSDNNDNKNSDQGTSDNGQQQQGETGSNEEGSSNTGPDNNLQTTTGGEGEQGGTGPVTPPPGPIDCSTSPNDPSCTIGCPRDPETGECIAHIDCAPRPGLLLLVYKMANVCTRRTATT